MRPVWPGAALEVQATAEVGQLTAAVKQSLGCCQGWGLHRELPLHLFQGDGDVQEGHGRRVGEQGMAGVGGGAGRCAASGQASPGHPPPSPSYWQ